MRLFICIALSVITLLPVSGKVLHTGTYKLEWTASDSGKGFPARYEHGDLKAMEQRLSGLSSDKAYWGRIGDFTIIIDELQGTDTGYDTAYLLSGAPQLTGIDIRQATKIHLEHTGTWRSADDNKWRPSIGSPLDKRPATIDIISEESGAAVKRPVGVTISINMLPDDWNKDRPFTGQIAFLGSWQGTIDTDEGSIEVHAIDLSQNGIYGDTGGNEYTRDAIVIKPKSLRDIFDCTLLPLGDAVWYEGKLYLVEVNKTGDTLKIQPYTGKTGTLKINAVDGLGRGAAHFRVELYNGERSLCINSKNGNMFTLPIGEYRAKILIGPVLGPEQEEFAISVNPKDKVNIDGKNTTVLKAGGAMKMVIAPGMEVITAKAGDAISIPISFTMADSELDYIMTYHDPVVNLRNSKGKILLSEVLSGLANIIGGGICCYDVKIPSNWKPGTYQIGASFELGPYQKPIYAKKTLKIVK